jgi:phosphate starvation-inducible PhoH-like protein
MSRRRQTNRKKPANSGFKTTRLIGKSTNQKAYLKAIRDNQIVFATGPAGSGKTHIAAGSAVKMLKAHGVERICICRPVVGVGKDIGYLPGNMEEKVGPYLTPLFDELCCYMERSKLRELLDEGGIEIVPLGMMRGRTFNNSFVILDEAQNATMVELRLLLTRIGVDSKMVIAGDLLQSDLPADLQGALKIAMRSLEDIEGIASVSLTGEDIVRNPLIADIERYLPRISS